MEQLRLSATVIEPVLWSPHAATIEAHATTTEAATTEATTT